MHMYYTEFDWLPDSEIENVLPEDGLPEGLHIEDYDDTLAAASFTKTEFHDWIWEGRHDCDVAVSLLRFWATAVRGSSHDTIADYFD